MILHKLESALKKRHPIFSFLPAITVSFMGLESFLFFVATKNGWITRPSFFYKPSASTAFNYSMCAFIWWVLGAILYVRRKH